MRFETDQDRFRGFRENGTWNGRKREKTEKSRPLQKHSGRVFYQTFLRDGSAVSLILLLRKELSCSRKRIHRLMNELGISSVRKRAYRAATNSKHSHPIAPNLLMRKFSFDAPNRAWVGDITYILTGEGWLYLATVKELCTKQTVGDAFSDRIDTNLTLAALDAAVRRRHPKPGLIFHSDRGIQYAVCAYHLRLTDLGIRQSMSRKGDPYDNAVAENFFSCLKCECVHLMHFSSRNQVKAGIFAYIEVFCNSVRPHSSIGWQTLDAFARSMSVSYVA